MIARTAATARGCARVYFGLFIYIYIIISFSSGYLCNDVVLERGILFPVRALFADAPEPYYTCHARAPAVRYTPRSPVRFRIITSNFQNHYRSLLYARVVARQTPPGTDDVVTSFCIRMCVWVGVHSFPLDDPYTRTLRRIRGQGDPEQKIRATLLYELRWRCKRVIFKTPSPPQK